MITQIIEIPLFNSDKKGYRIRETVTAQGHTIDWPILYSTREAAQNEIDKVFRRNAFEQHAHFGAVFDHV